MMRITSGQGEREVGRNRRGGRLAAVSILAAVVCLSAMVCMGYATTRHDQTASDDLRLQALSGTIVHSDEILTMSAMMCAATGDLAWERRYREHEPVLDSAIHDAMRLLDREGVLTRVEGTNEANLALVAMENSAFDLVRAGKRDQAHQLLTSERYHYNKKLYATGMSALAEAIRAQIATSHNEFQLYTRLLLILTGLTTVATAIPWFLIVAADRERRALGAKLDEMRGDLHNCRLQTRDEPMSGVIRRNSQLFADQLV